MQLMTLCIIFLIRFNIFLIKYENKWKDFMFFVTLYKNHPNASIGLPKLDRTPKVSLRWWHRHMLIYRANFQGPNAARAHLRLGTSKFRLALNVRAAADVFMGLRGL